jgi:hypothetical protein
MNENIKYSRKPVYSFLEDLPDPNEKRQVRTCISGISEACVKSFLTTKEIRICKHCRHKIDVGNWA